MGFTVRPRSSLTVAPCPGLRVGRCRPSSRSLLHDCAAHDLVEPAVGLVADDVDVAEARLAAADREEPEVDAGLEALDLGVEDGAGVGAQVVDAGPDLAAPLRDELHLALPYPLHGAVGGGDASPMALFR